MSSKPLYACATCGEDFTRKTSAERHKGNVHNGNCFIVRFIEYIAGRASGRYTPPVTPSRLLRKNKKLLMQFHNNSNNNNTSQPQFVIAADNIIAHEIRSENALEKEYENYNKPRHIKQNNDNDHNNNNNNQRSDPFGIIIEDVRKLVELKGLYEKLG